MCDNLTDFLENNQNPWDKLAEACYVLDNENDVAGNKEYDLHTDLPPQPFQGNPKAPVWILLLNPGYNKDDKIYYSENKDRRAAILAQLKFKKIAEKHWHYVLDNEENNPSRQWFEKHCLNEGMGITADNADDKIFILQALGYASEKLDGNLSKMANSFPHMLFAQKLARWGLKNGKKIVIARCKYYWLDVLDAEKHPENFHNIYFLSSPHNVSFSAGNIVNWYKYQQLKENSAAKLQLAVKINKSQ